MAGLKFTTDLDADTLYKMAFRRAQDMGFTVREIEDQEFAASKGNLALSIIAGAFVAYCDFRVSVEEYDDGNEITLERNRPWWTGAIGVSRSYNWAKDLMKNVRDEVVRRGGKVSRDKEF